MNGMFRHKETGRQVEIVCCGNVREEGHGQWTLSVTYRTVDNNMIWTVPTYQFKLKFDKIL